MDQLRKAVQDAFAELAGSGKINEMICKQVEETVGSIIKDMFRSYSDFGKSLEEAMKNSLNVDFSGMGMAGYNDYVLKIIKGVIDTQLQSCAQDGIEEKVARLLDAPPKEIKLSDLVEKFKEGIMEHWDGMPQEQSCTCVIEPSEHGGGWVELDAQPDKTMHNCDIHLALTKEGKVFNVKLRDVLRDESFKDDKPTRVKFGFEQLLFQLYCGNTKLILDEDYVNTEYYEN